jgi:hypothetical protein
VFLWVTFVLKAVVAGLNDGNTLFELQEKVDSLPKELNPLFRTLLNSIHETDKKFAYAPLHVAIHLAGRHRPVDVLDIPSDMSVFRYSFLDDLWRDLDYVAIHEAHNFSPEQLKDRLDRTRRRVRGLCKGLLDITTRRHSWNNSIPATEVVRLTHRSVVDFLEQDELKDEMAKYRSDVDWFDLYCHTFLAQIKFLSVDQSYFQPGRTDEPADYLESGFANDLSAILTRACRCGPTRLTPSFLGFLDDLNLLLVQRKILSADADYSRSDVGIEIGKVPFVVMNNSIHFSVILAAALYGLVEYLKRIYETNPPFFESEPQQRALLSCVLASNDRREIYRLIGTLSFCLESGVSPNCKTLPRGHYPGSCSSASIWHRFLYEIILSLRYDCFRLYWAMPKAIEEFLRYGADPYFRLKFGPRYIGDCRSKELIALTFQCGANRSEPFDPVLMTVSLAGLPGHARRRGWTLFLRDLLEIWAEEQGRPKPGVDLKKLLQEASVSESDSTEASGVRPDFFTRSVPSSVGESEGHLKKRSLAELVYYQHDWIVAPVRDTILVFAPYRDISVLIRSDSVYREHLKLVIPGCTETDAKGWGSNFGAEGQNELIEGRMLQECEANDTKT